MICDVTRNRTQTDFVRYTIRNYLASAQKLNGRHKTFSCMIVTEADARWRKLVTVVVHVMRKERDSLVDDAICT